MVWQARANLAGHKGGRVDGGLVHDAIDDRAHPVLNDLQPQEVRAQRTNILKFVF